MQVGTLLSMAKICIDRVGSDLLTFSETDDLSDFERQMTGIGKEQCHPMVSDKLHDFASDDVFGLYIKADGVCIGGMVARLVRLGSDSLDRHLLRSYSRYYRDCGGSPVTPRLNITRQITGNVVYQGELFLSPNWRGGRVNVSAVMHYAHILSALKWQPDWIYAFMRIEGLPHASGYGFTRQHVGALNWIEGHPRRSDKECLVALPLHEFIETAEYFVLRPEQFAVR